MSMSGRELVHLATSPDKRLFSIQTRCLTSGQTGIWIVVLQEWGPKVQLGPKAFECPCEQAAPGGMRWQANVREALEQMGERKAQEQAQAE
jgi:hypothetical protein